MTDLPDLIQHSVLAQITRATTPAERAKLAQAAFEMVDDDRYPRPLPRFMCELPTSGDDSEVATRIAAAILVAENPDEVQKDAGTRSAKDLVGRPVTVWDVRAAPSGLDKGWGAYLLVDATVDRSEVHEVVNTGAPQVCARLARAYADGKLPISGAFAAVGGTGKKGNPVLTFIGEDDF